MTIAMRVYRFVWPTGYSAHMTVPQYEKACMIAEQYGLTHTVEVQPVFGSDGQEIMMNVGDLWIAVLPDGSSHS